MQVLYNRFGTKNTKSVQPKTGAVPMEETSCATVVWGFMPYSLGLRVLGFRAVRFMPTSLSMPSELGMAQRTIISLYLQVSSLELTQSTRQSSASKLV